MISIVWILSGIICFPPLAGWSRPQPVVDGRPLCVLSEEPGYVLYSIVGSFYLPLSVMAAVYIKIYLAARWRARRHLRGAGGRRPGCVELKPTSSHRPAVDNHRARRVTAVTVTAAELGASSAKAAGVQMTDSHGHAAEAGRVEGGRGAIIVVTHVKDDDAAATDDDACPASSDVCASLSSDKRVYDVEVDVDRGLYVKAEFGDDAATSGMDTTLCNEVDTSPASSSPSSVHQASTLVQRSFVDEKKHLLTSVAPSATRGYRTVTTCESNRPTEPDHLQVRQQPMARRARRGSRLGDVSGRDAQGVSGGGGGACETELDRAKKRTARARERRATLVLGIVMISFVGCWLPFFAVYPISLLTGLNRPHHDLPPPVFEVCR